MELKRINDKQCIQIPTWSKGRFPDHWYPGSSKQVEKAKAECESHVDHRRVGSYCLGYTTTKIEYSWIGKQCRRDKETLVGRQGPGICTKQGVPL